MYVLIQIFVMYVLIQIFVMYVLIQIIVCYPLQTFAGSFPWCYMYVGWQELRETCILVLALEF